MTIQEQFDEVSTKVDIISFLVECCTYGLRAPGFQADKAISLLETHVQWLRDSVNELGETIYKVN